jgi:hypothetical protein
MIIAAEVLDILAILFGLIGVETTGNFPWSHGLVMSIVWSLVFGVVSVWIFRNYRIGIFLGCLVFSHWVIDFITHPMGAVFGGHPAAPDLPLLFGGSQKVGLGLYNYSIVVAYAIEYGTIAIGIAVYVLYTLRQRYKAKNESENSP